MQRTKSQLNAISYSYRDRLERRRNAFNALYWWLMPGDDFTVNSLKSGAEDGLCGEFVKTQSGYREARRSINWIVFDDSSFFFTQFAGFELYRAAVRAQKSRYYRRRLAKLGIDWKNVKRPYGTEAIELD